MSSKEDPMENMTAIVCLQITYNVNLLASLVR